jgi:hypothetical protein
MKIDKHDILYLGIRRWSELIDLKSVQDYS